jgi:hypothetical protein
MMTKPDELRELANGVLAGALHGPPPMETIVKLAQGVLDMSMRTEGLTGLLAEIWQGAPSGHWRDDFQVRVDNALDTPESVTIHRLVAGLALCGFGGGKPPCEWPSGHYWSGDTRDVNCEACHAANQRNVKRGGRLL